VNPFSLIRLVRNRKDRKDRKSRNTRDRDTCIMHGKISAPPRSAVHLIADSHNRTIAETDGGLAFSIGVAVIECETTKDCARHYCIRHPNNVCIYHVYYIMRSVSVVAVDTSKPVTSPCTWPL
jgi:hypothetical protein